MDTKKNQRNELQGESAKTPDVKMLAWNISPWCNLTCKHCYLGEIKGYDSLSTHELDRIVDQISSIDVKVVFLAGGEPLLIRNLEYVIRQLAQTGVSVFVNTNGILLTEKRIDSLLRSQVSGVIIGFDGITQESYEMIRGEHTYQQALQGLKTAIKMGMSVESDFTLNCLNRHQLNSVPLWGDELKLKRITVKRYVPRPESKFDSQLRLTPQILKETYHDFLDIFPYPSQRESCKIYAHDPLFIVAKAEKGLLNQEDILREDCNAGGYTRGWIGLSSQGNIQPCPVMTEEVVGNILSEELQDIVKCSKMDIIRDAIPAICQKCHHSSYCRGGCKATKIRMGTSLDKPDPCCWIYHK
ncbi:Radical SAM domain protein [Limnospira maxima CS-328]|uniref:Radical SAM domain protein n=1 Tax=Limnospira maxima CS-328 TaxID=513049 RepID=B5VZA6_LIMMA|nr:radical SAM protein [Limnospira maxima]EDZ95307.1 Radical SAM domain protein [Limnospira maxima CS-328]MDC0839017.1 radical SAM protein [Limnoraphis robusta]